MTRRTLILALIVMLTSFGSAAAHAGLGRHIRSWLCFYGAAFPEGPVPAYDLYVLGSTAHPPLEPLKKQGSMAVGYVSLGEINVHDPRFPALKKQKILVDVNKAWPEAHRVDIGAPAWQTHVLDTLVPEVLAQGFDGIFIDTIDTARYLEEEKHKSGAVAKAAELIRRIRERYPQIVIVLNNGLFLVDDVGSVIDALVVEDIYTLYRFEDKTYAMATPAWTSERLEIVKKFQIQFHKPVLSLDYLAPTDTKGIAAVAARAKAEGFVPFISEIGLTTIFYHP